jgi:alkanesulfonate monooxygenase SsuD/methylene tetrahydromethanopterin reductase-like flavin-dependent oxidoreductase (luciferase family)
MIDLGITDHVEGPRDQSSAALYAEIAEQTRCADRLGFDYAWFAEHHAHIHQGHLPAPLLLALHLAPQTRTIRLGTAIICLNLHHPLLVAEQCAVADLLMEGRSAFGFGSGSTPEESGFFGHRVQEQTELHARFESALRLLRAAWQGDIPPEIAQPLGLTAQAPLPWAREDLAARCWIACNSVGSAHIAGLLGFNLLFSHLRTPQQYRAFSSAYAQAGGRGLIAANRPVHVACDDDTAFARALPALRKLWLRFHAEGKIPSAARLSSPKSAVPQQIAALCAHPINFIVGGPQTVARQIAQLHAQIPFDVLNCEVRWDGLAPQDIHDCLHRLAQDVRPLLPK